MIVIVMITHRWRHDGRGDAKALYEEEAGEAAEEEAEEDNDNDARGPGLSCPKWICRRSTFQTRSLG